MNALVFLSRPSSVCRAVLVMRIQLRLSLFGRAKVVVLIANTTTLVPNNLSQCPFCVLCMQFQRICTFEPIH